MADNGGYFKLEYGIKANTITLKSLIGYYSLQSDIRFISNNGFLTLGET